MDIMRNKPTLYPETGGFCPARLEGALSTVTQRCWRSLPVAPSGPAPLLGSSPPLFAVPPSREARCTRSLPPAPRLSRVRITALGEEGPVEGVRASARCPEGLAFSVVSPSHPPQV